MFPLVKQNNEIINHLVYAASIDVMPKLATVRELNIR